VRRIVPPGCAWRAGVIASHRGRHQRGAGDHEAEGEHAAGDLERAFADGVVEDEDAAADRDQVGGDRMNAITSSGGPSCRLRADA
jgi:hypothetical protein